MSFIEPIENIIVKYAVGEATPAESNQVEHWLLLDMANRKRLDNIVLLLKQSDQLPLPGPVDEQLAWQRFRQRLETAPAIPVHKQRLGWWMRVAACLIVVAGAFTLYFLFPRKQKELPVAFLSIFSGNQSRTDTLPDGSVVSLVKNSNLQYPARFSSNLRNVRLQGAAFFTVAHNPDKPFTIAVADILVTVLGTSFTISSTGARTEIMVKTGVVLVSRKSQQLTLMAGEAVMVLQKDSLLMKEKKEQPPVVKTEPLVREHKNNLAGDPAKQKEIMRSIIDEIVKDHIAKDRNSIEWFGLNENEFSINGEKQPEAIYKKYRKKYLLVPGYGFYYGPSKLTGNGFFFTKKEMEQ